MSDSTEDLARYVWLMQERVPEIREAAASAEVGQWKEHLVDDAIDDLLWYIDSLEHELNSKYLDDEPTVGSFFSDESRWDCVGETPSGKLLYQCAACGRQTPTPDRTCSRYGCED